MCIRDRPNPYGQPQPDPYAAQAQNPYAQAQAAQPNAYGQAQAPYAQPASPYDPLAGMNNPYSNPYAQPAQPGYTQAGAAGVAGAMGAAAGYASFVPGMNVSVMWGNGTRYPGQVQQVQGAQVLVVFQDGQSRWIESQYVTAA